MAGKSTLAGKIAEDYCRTYAHLPSRQIARMLRTNEPEIFSSIEVARQRVKYYRGRNGTESRRNRKGHIIPRLELPEPAETDFRWHKLPDGVKCWLILADLHIPYYDRKALEAALEWGKDCGGVLYLGDLIDCYKLSTFEKDPRARDFSDELIMTGQVLDVVEQRVKPAKTVYKYGNHERRHERFMYSRAPEFLNVVRVPPGGNAEPRPEGQAPPLFSIAEYLALAERGITVVPPQHPIEHHSLTLLHGDEWQRGSSTSVNPARTAYLRGHDIAFVAHSHVTSQHTEPTLRGVTTPCWSVGCLCNLHPEYAPLNKWNHGAAKLTTGSEWRIENRRIVDGQIV